LFLFTLLGSAQGAMESKSGAECDEWLQRVHSVQTAAMTPERREEIRMKAERSRAAEASRRKVKAVKSHAVRSKALVSEGLRQMSCASAPSDYAMVQSRWASAQEASSKRQDLALCRAVELERSDAPEAMAMCAEEEDAEEADGMAEAAALVGGDGGGAVMMLAGAGAASTDSGGAAEDEFEKLLDQLKVEPSNDEESAAKFCLYETYGEEVTKMRLTLFGLYEENKASLPDAVKKDMEKELKDIDRAEAMGIPDESRAWFVYHMMRQARSNNTTMEGVMNHFEKKLEFLVSNDQDDCPICLEPFSATCPATTLGCCHKVCGECWAHWVAVMHGHPFCPLCKNEEFVETLHRRASSDVPMEPSGGY